MTNTVALGAALGLVGYDFKLLNELLTGFFSGETAIKNVKAAKAGYEYAQKLSVLSEKTDTCR